MDFGTMLGDPWYTKEALIDKYMRWLILIIGSIIFPIILGYTLRVYRANDPPIRRTGSRSSSTGSILYRRTDLGYPGHHRCAHLLRRRLRR